MTDKKIYWFLAITQLICSLVVIGDMVISVFGLRKTVLAWEILELLQLMASLGLVLGSVLGFQLLSVTLRRNDKVENQLQMVSGEFAQLVSKRFEEWELTPAEKEIALFALKGLKISEIAELRGAREGTVKAQTHAIYRKAGVSGRTELLSFFMDDLINFDQIRVS